MKVIDLGKSERRTRMPAQTDRQLAPLRTQGAQEEEGELMGEIFKT